MSYSYFINALGETCGNCGMVTYYAAEPITSDVSAIYLDSNLTFKLYNGSITTVGWTSEYLGAAMYYGTVSQIGDIVGTAACEVTPTTTTTLAPETTTTTTLAPTTTTTLAPTTTTTLAPTTTTSTTEATYCSLLSPTIQPSFSGITFSRSPIVYRFDNILVLNYTFCLYISGSTPNNTIYTTITRESDYYNATPGCFLEVSNMIRNYLKNNISYTQNNLAYFRASLYINGGSPYTNCHVYTNSSTAVLGYTDYEQPVTGRFNLTTDGEYLMNTIPENKPYYIPNYSDSSYVVTWRYLNISTGYNIKYTNNSGTEITFNTTFSASTNSALSEIREVPIGYYDLYNFYGKTDINYDMPIELTFVNCYTELKKYIFYPDKCNGNNLYTIKFMNRYGMWENFFFRGRTDTDLDYDYETYKYNNVDYATMTYNKSEGSYHKSFINGKNKITLNTGWIDEIKNAQIQELLLSEYTLIDDYPVIITDKTMKYKTIRYDKLINYTLVLEKAYDVINNII